MPPSTSTTKSSPTAPAVVVVVDAEAKELDESNTQTSESVCSSSGTDGETITTVTAATAGVSGASTHAVTMAHRGTECFAVCTTQELTVAPDHHAKVVAYTQSPTSPTPCCFVDETGSDTVASATPLSPHTGAVADALVSDTGKSSPSSTSERRTPAPPPPIDFCGPSAAESSAAHNTHILQLVSVPATSATAIATAAAAGTSESDVLVSPVSTAPDMAATPSTSASPASTMTDGFGAMGSGTVKAPRTASSSVSTLQASSEPFYPVDRSAGRHSVCSGGGAPAAAAGPAGMPPHSSGHRSKRQDSSLSGPPPLVSPASTPRQAYATPGGWATAAERRTSPPLIPCCVGEEYMGGVDGGGGGGGALSTAMTSGGARGRLVHGQPGMSHRNAAAGGGAAYGNSHGHGSGYGSNGGYGHPAMGGSAYSRYWHDAATAGYYPSHYHSAALGGECGGGGGGGPLMDDPYGYAAFANGVGMGHEGLALSHSGDSPASLRPTGHPGMSAAAAAASRSHYTHWSTSASLPMTAEDTLPAYSGARALFLPEPPLGAGAGSGSDHDYADGMQHYAESSYSDPDMRFGSYVPQNIQCVEHLEELECICHGLLAESALMQQQYRRRCRERQYLAEESPDEEEAESKLMVALDLEGRSLGRAGSICIITLATYSAVYIIDMVLLGAAALAERSALKAVLEAEGITKLMFDCRADCDALYFLYHVRLRNVCDLQIASCFTLFPTARHLPSMKDVFRVLGLFADEDTDIKNAGRHLFNPESGGSFDRWEERPLPDILLHYCAVDVKYFFLAKMMLWDHLGEGYYLGEARLASVCAGNFVGCSKGNSLREF